MLFSYLAELCGKTMLLKTPHTYLSCRTWKNHASTDLGGAIHAAEREKYLSVLLRCEPGKPQ